jgi:hypothetical protein
MTGNRAEIQIPFLNAYRHHRDTVTVKVLCDGAVMPVVASGRGDGWSVTHTNLSRSFGFRAIVALAIAAVGLVVQVWALPPYTDWLFEVHKAPRDQFHLIVFLWQIPAYVLVYVLPWAGIAWMFAGVLKALRGMLGISKLPKDADTKSADERA